MAQLGLFPDEFSRRTLRELWAEDAASRPVAKLNSTVEPEDAPRLTAALQRLYEHMRDGRWMTATELTDVAGRRYGARLWELARAGIPHESERLSGGEWRYRLIGSCVNGVGGNSAPRV